MRPLHPRVMVRRKVRPLSLEGQRSASVEMPVALRSSPTQVRWNQLRPLVAAIGPVCPALLARTRHRLQISLTFSVRDSRRYATKFNQGRKQFRPIFYQLDNLTKSNHALNRIVRGTVFFLSCFAA